MLVKLGNCQINTERVVLVMPMSTFVAWPETPLKITVIGDRATAKSALLLSGGELFYLPEDPETLARFLNLTIETPFEEALNNMVAPVTRAWMFERIISASMTPDTLSLEEPEFVVRVAVKRKR